MNAEERYRILGEVRQASNCAHPIRLTGQMVDLATGEMSARGLKVACKDRRAVLCPSCSALYKKDAWILVSAGLVGGKGVDPVVSLRHKFFLTLTAPSFGQVHTRDRQGRCHPRAKQHEPFCPHGNPTLCRSTHEEGNDMLGTPLCRECFDYQGAVLWNAHAGRLFTRTIQQLGRVLAKHLGVSVRDFERAVRLSYLKVAELQRRGLVHFHVVLRIDPRGSTDCVPFLLTSDTTSMAVAEVVTMAKVRGLDGTELSWGAQFDLAELGSFGPELNRIATYVAKYSVKTSDGSKEFAYRFDDRSQIENLRTSEHLRNLSLTAWDLSLDERFVPLKLRLHAQVFGFTGQLITKSRHFSTTFGALREARANFSSSANSHEVIGGTFNYAGRGYDDPRAVQLAELFSRFAQEIQREENQMRRLRTSYELQ